MDPRSFKSHALLSLIAAVFVGVLVFFGTGGMAQLEGSSIRAAIWFVGTFVVAFIGIAVLSWAVKDDNGDANKPRLK
ncbi:MAG: hypothetical protein ACKOWH_00630 [Rhodoluna sp.]